LRRKVVKKLVFALSLAIFVGSPAVGQALGTDGYQFIEAVKKRDGNTATSMLESHPRGFVDTKGDGGDTGLLIAINRGDEQWTGFLLNKGADPNLAGRNGETPLIAAAKVGFERAIEWLISEGARVDGTNRSGETPLIIAVQQRNLPVVRQLLKAGANPDKSDAVAGYSARDYATRDTRAREILKLIETTKPKAGTSAAK
jgi:ankyrin repeat protein